MKNITRDESGLIFLPVVIGISAIAGYLGFNWLTDGTDPIEVLQVLPLASILVVLGVIALMGKFMLLPKFLSIVIGIICIGVAIYLVYLGELPTW